MVTYRFLKDLLVYHVHKDPARLPLWWAGRFLLKEM